jgi:RHS repeat-associated protein
MKLTPMQARHLAGATRRERLFAALERQGLNVTRARNGELTATDGAGRTSTITVGADGSTLIRSAEGREAALLHDDQGRLRQLRDPGGLVVAIDSDTDDRQVTVTRGDRPGHRIMVDEQGRLQQLEFPDGSHQRIEHGDKQRRVMDRNGAIATHDLDDAGRLTAYTNPLGHITRFAYGEGELARRIVEADGTTHDFVVDADGLLQSWTVNGREHARYEWDSTRKACTVHYADGTTLARVYDDAGRVVEARTGDSCVQITYDSAGRILTENQDGQVVQYAYDGGGLLTTLTTPEGVSLRFQRDGEGRVVRVQDWSGSATSLEYLPVGALGRIVFPNHVTTTRTANELGLTTAIRTLSPGGTQVLVDVGLGYDVNDRIRSCFDGQQRRTFGYDAEGRLLNVKDEAGRTLESSAFDGAGNCTSWSSAGIPGEERSYDAANRLRMVGGTPVMHDALGNVTAAPLPRGTASLRWNGAGHLVSAQVAGQTVIYRYDGLGRRIEKRIGDTVTRYVWAGATLLVETCSGKGSPFTRREHLFIPNTFHPLAMRVDGRIYYQHVDQAGRPWCLTDERGRAAWQAVPSAWGSVRITVARVANPWRLANQYHDDETGLHYNLARYYQPGWGRYLSCDPLRSRGSGWNYYLYALGDPVNKADPTGEIIPIILVAMGVGLVIGAAMGAGMEYLKQRGEIKEGKRTDLDSDGIIAQGILGGFVGAVGGAIGAVAAVGAGAALGVTAAVEAGTASLGTIMGLGAIEGIASSVAEACAEAAAMGQAPSASDVAISVLLGGGIGALTAGIGGYIAARLARRAARKAAAEAAEKAERELAEKAQRELAEKAARESAERALREAAERAGMQPAHVRNLQKLAKEKQQIIVMRSSNPDSLAYHGKDGYRAKPHDVEKLKTAKPPDPRKGLVVEPKPPGPNATAKEIADYSEQLDEIDILKKSKPPWTFDSDGHLRDPEGNMIHGDYDMQGVYQTSPGNKPTKVDTNNRKFLTEMNETTPDRKMYQHGANDNYEVDGKMGRQPKSDETYLVIDEAGNTKTINSTAELKEYYGERDIAWPYDS